MCMKKFLLIFVALILLCACAKKEKIDVDAINRKEKLQEDTNGIPDTPKELAQGIAFLVAQGELSLASQLTLKWEAEGKCKPISVTGTLPDKNSEKEMYKFLWENRKEAINELSKYGKVWKASHIPLFPMVVPFRKEEVPVALVEVLLVCV